MLYKKVNLKYIKMISNLYLQACNTISMFTPSVHCVCHLILPFFSALNWPLWLLPRIKDTKYLCTCNKYACHACLSTLHFFRINQLSLKFIEFCYGIPFKLTAAVKIKVNTLKQENNPKSTVWPGPIWIKLKISWHILSHYHLQVQANSKKIVQKKRCYF